MRDVVKNRSSSANRPSNSKKSAARRARRRKRNLALYYLLTVIVVLTCVLILSLTVFFRIDSVTVTGTDKYTFDEVVAITKLKPGDNIFRINIEKIEETLKSELPYAENVTIKRHLPSTISINIEEAEVGFNFVDGEKYYLVSKKGKILDSDIKTPIDNLITVKGFEMNKSTLNTTISSVDVEKESIFLKIVECIDEIDFDGIKVVDLTDKGNIILDYEGRISIELGNLNDYKDRIKTSKTIIDDKVEIDFEGRLIVWDSQTYSLKPN